MERPEIVSTDGTSKIASTTDGNDPSGSLLSFLPYAVAADNQRDD